MSFVYLSHTTYEVLPASFQAVVVAVHCVRENRPYAILHVTKLEMDSEWKSRYYSASLGTKKDSGLWSISTAKYCATSSHQSHM